MKVFLSLFLALCSAFGAYAITWDEITTGGGYYFGTGTGETEAEAKANAIADMLTNIATNVHTGFDQVDIIESHSGETEHRARVVNCVRTYACGTIEGLELFRQEYLGKAPNLTARVYVSKADFEQTMQKRADKAVGMVGIAEDCLESGKIDLAIQYYYWAYSLLRSLRNANDIKDVRGLPMVETLPIKIGNIMSDIHVRPVSRHDNYVTLAIDYQGKPVSSLQFRYNDGRAECDALAKDGRGMIDLIDGINPDFYHVNIEYQYKNQARGDVEMETVLDAITPRPFRQSVFEIPAIPNDGEAQATTLRPQTPATQPGLSVATQISEQAANTPATPAPPAADPEQPDNRSMSRRAPITTPTPWQAEAVEGIVRALSSRSYSNALRFFTPAGLQMFNRLTNYGHCRVLDGSHIRYYKGVGGRVTARGLRMAFSFNGRHKKTFVEDISLTFATDGKVESVAFGLGRETEAGIYDRNCKWSSEVREILVSFLENYKTAYALERLDYLKQIFSDDAVIITGTVLTNASGRALDQGNAAISSRGKDIIRYTQYTKGQYIEHLAETFNRNEFINIKFSQNEIQTDQRGMAKDWYAINIRQQYESSRYSDIGYLFLLVNMTDPAAPTIYVRTWQPNEVDINELYTMGDFFD